MYSIRARTSCSLTTEACLGFCCAIGSNRYHSIYNNSLNPFRNNPYTCGCGFFCHGLVSGICKQNQNDREHHNYVLNVKLRDETQSTSQAEGKQNQTISAHIVFTTPPPKDLLTKMNMDPILSAELRSMLDNHSEEVCKLINEYITKNLLDQLPTSFEFPTSQLCLKKLAYPNQMGPQFSPQILFLQR